MSERTVRQRLAENLRVRRFVLGWSQEALAAAAGLERSYVSAVERADRNIGIDNLERLAAALGISIAELLEPPDPDGLGQCLLERIRRGLRDEEAVYEVTQREGGSQRDEERAPLPDWLMTG